MEGSLTLSFKMSIYIVSVISSMLVGGISGFVTASGAISEFLIGGLLVGPTGSTGPKGATGLSSCMSLNFLFFLLKNNVIVFVDGYFIFNEIYRRI